MDLLLPRVVKRARRSSGVDHGSWRIAGLSPASSDPRATREISRSVPKGMLPTVRLAVTARKILVRISTLDLASLTFFFGSSDET